MSSISSADVQTSTHVWVSTGRASMPWRLPTKLFLLWQDPGNKKQGRRFTSQKRNDHWLAIGGMCGGAAQHGDGGFKYPVALPNLTASKTAAPAPMAPECAVQLSLPCSHVHRRVPTGSPLVAALVKYESRRHAGTDGRVARSTIRASQDNHHGAAGRQALRVEPTDTRRSSCA